MSMARMTFQRQLRKVRVVAMLLAALLVAAGESRAQIFVDANLAASGSGNNDGTSWQNAYYTLQQALIFAQQTGGGSILVAEGTYETDSNTQLRWPQGSSDPKAGTFLVPTTTHVKGGFLGSTLSSNPSVLPDQPDGSYNKTILTGATNASYHVVVAPNLSDGSVDGFRIIRGNAQGQTSPNKEGGGFWGDGLVRWTLEHCKFRENLAVSGGGIYYQGNGQDFVIRTCTIRENQALRGGGMLVRHNTYDLRMVNVQFVENGRGDYTQTGGGLHLEYEVQLQGSNVLFHDNVAVVAGGGIYCDPDDLGSATDLHYWKHLTVSKNRLTGSIVNGAGIHYDLGHPNAQAYLDNSIVWGNLGGIDLYVAVPPPPALGMSFQYQFCDIGSATGGNGLAGNISADPLFVNAPAGNFRLRDMLLGPPLSPCLDAASRPLVGSDFGDVNENNTNEPELPWDLDETARVVDLPTIPGEVDMGAYEGPAYVTPGQ